jgi:hypothetical protein
MRSEERVHRTYLASRPLWRVDAELAEEIQAAWPATRRRIAIEAARQAAKAADWPRWVEQAIELAEQDDFSSKARRWLTDAAASSSGAARTAYEAACAALDPDPTEAALAALYAAAEHPRDPLIIAARRRLSGPPVTPPREPMRVSLIKLPRLPRSRGICG